MKTNCIVLLLICSGYLSFSQERKSEEELRKQMNNQFNQYNGEALPDFKLISIDGKTKKLSDLKNKIILLDFWASWCSACIESNPLQKEAYKRLKKKYKSDFEWINISIDKDTSAWKKSLKLSPKAGVNLIASMDSISKNYHLHHFPTLILIDANHKVIGFDLGGLMHDESVYLEYAIYKAMSGVNTALAMEQSYNTEAKKNSTEFQKWCDEYYTATK